MVLSSGIYCNVARRKVPTCFMLLFLGLFFDIKDGGDIFLRNTGSRSTSYKASDPTYYNHQCENHRNHKLIVAQLVTNSLVLWNRNFYCRVHICQPSLHILSQMNPARIIMPCFLDVYAVLTLSSSFMCLSQEIFFLLVFRPRFCTYFRLAHAYHTF
jgi:hypothetical protein